MKPAQLALRKSVLQNVFFPFGYSLREIVQSECGSSRGEERHVLLSECSSDISSHLVSCHLSKWGDVTECELILARAGIHGFSVAQVAGMTICPRHRHLSGRFWRAPKSCQYPGHDTGKTATVVGNHVVNFQMAEENMFFNRWNDGRRITQVLLSLFFWRSKKFFV